MKGRNTMLVANLEDMVNCHNALCSYLDRSLKGIKAYGKTNRLVSVLAFAGAAFSLKQIKDLADKVDRLQEKNDELTRKVNASAENW